MLPDEVNIDRIKEDRHLKRFVLIVISVAIATIAWADPAGPSKVIRHPGDGVPGQYIAVLAGTPPSSAVNGIATALAAAYSIEVDTVWEYSLRGFLCRGSDANIDAMARDARIRFIEQDLRTHAPEPQPSAMQSAWWDPIDGDCTNPTGDCQYMWHLDRIDETSWSQGDSEHNMCTEGRSVYAYVIDTGIEADHPQFETPTRVVLSLDFSSDRTNQAVPFTPDVTNGCNATGYRYYWMWHGTAVASVLGGTQVGAAKPRLVSLKVARCDSGQTLTSSLISATNWIANNNPSDPNRNPYFNSPGVINHSGFVPDWRDDASPAGSDRSAYSAAVAGLVAATSKPFFTSADNFSADACKFAPNDLARTNYRSGSVMVVGGTSVGIGSDPNDYRFQKWVNPTTPSTGQDSGSNAGPCVSIYAPATSIFAARTSAYAEQYGTLYARESGTSFASPIVAAVAARYIEKSVNQTGIVPSAQSVYSWLLSSAGASIQNTGTTGYWYCTNRSAPPYQYTYLSNPPALCPADSWGYDPSTQTWGQNRPPYYFTSVGNESGARMVYWDEGLGLPEGECIAP